MAPFPRLFASPAPAFSGRRDFLGRTGSGFGLVALASLLERQGLLGAPPEAKPVNPLAPRAPHVRTPARSMIWLFLNGDPSQVDTFDHKPALEKLDGKELDGFDKNTGFFTEQVRPVIA